MPRRRRWPGQVELAVMAAFTVLVTGVPGSGKTTVARELSVRLGLPLLSMDTIKEQLFTTLGVGDRAWALQLRTASLAVIWSLLPDCPDGAIVDLWLDPERDRGVAQSGLTRAGVGPVLEVLCAPPAPVAAARYAARSRHPGHLPPDEATLTRTREAAELIAPLGLGPTLRLDTSSSVNADQVADWLRQRQP